MWAFGVASFGFSSPLITSTGTPISFFYTSASGA